MNIRSVIFAATAFAAATPFTPTLAQSTTPPVVVSATAPAIQGWYNGRPTVYFATDASDKTVAKGFGANFVPQLANAITSVPKSVDDIYVFTNFTQANVIPSAPGPLGPKNNNQAYTPLWQISQVTWVDGATRHTLRSERAILDAAARNQLTITKTNIVVNCAVVQTASGTLPNTVVNYK